MDRTDIKRIWIDNETIRIETNDGQIGVEYFSDYARLQNADIKTLGEYTLSYYGIHWPELDEDLSFDGFIEKTSMRPQR